MKKAFDQTVREIKREVNKKVLKVPGVEQKVLDATSNEPWGPHGTLLADIAQATRNYHEYQMIMQVIWKRINDIGKNWRHVYKGLTVLEYLVAHGSERVIDEIRERTYQISTLSDFQYIDHIGRDQGSNVRKKSQTLVNLVNDKERIEEVRQKAAVNRDRFRNTSLGGMYRHGSGGYGYEDDRYSSRDDDRNGYGREKEWGSDHYGRDGDYRGRSQSVDGYRYSPRSRSYDRERGRGYEDDGQYSSRGSGVKADDHFQDGSVSIKGIQRKFSEPNLNAPPSYEEAVTEARTSVHSERGGEIPSAPGPVRSSPSQTEVTSGVSAPPPSASPPPQASLSPPYPPPSNKEVDCFDEFDPRGPFGVAQPATRNADVDLLGSLYDLNPLAIVPVTPESTFSESDTSAGTIYSAAPSASQPFDDPFGDGPFRAQSQNIAPTNPYSQIPHTTDSSFVPQNFSTSNHDNTDVLADILPLCGPSPTVPSQTGLPPQHFSTNGYSAQASPHEQQANFPTHAPLQNTVVPQSNFGGHNNSVSQPAFQTANHYGNYLQQQQGQAAPYMVSQPGPLGPTQQFNTSNFISQNRHSSFESSNALALVPQPAEDRKFETKSTVWADTLSRGLVNLNISGSKTNPLADIGVDFDAINRREKRMEKFPTSNVTSTITMGKAMGSGSGIGRAGAGAIRPPIHSIGGPTMGIGGMNRPPMGMNMGGQNMRMGVNMGPNIGMNMGMAQGGGPMQQPYGGYNPMMVRGGGYVQTQPYGGGYR